jgi:hypothetical protein
MHQYYELMLDNLLPTVIIAVVTFASFIVATVICCYCRLSRKLLSKKRNIRKHKKSNRTQHNSISDHPTRQHGIVICAICGRQNRNIRYHDPASIHYHGGPLPCGACRRAAINRVNFLRTNSRGQRSRSELRNRQNIRTETLTTSPPPYIPPHDDRFG